jgi:hypothetical protein
MKKGLIFGLIAVLSAAFLITGCSQGTDSGSSTSFQIGGRLVDIAVGTEGALYAALNNPDYQIIGITSAIALTTSTGTSQVTEIPAGKTVVLYASLTPPTDAPLTVNGTVIVEGAGVLVGDHGTSEVEVNNGHIEVINGTISVDVPEAIHGVPVTQEIFGTGKVQFAGGYLTISNHLTTLEKVKTVFGWVPHGTVTIDGVDEDIKPSVLAAAIAAFPSTAIRRLVITDPVPFVAPGDTATEITIPVGLTFTTADPLASLTSLNVKGTLIATSATLAGVTDLAVSGTLTAGNATYTNLTSLTVERSINPLGFVINTPLSALELLEVKAGGIFASTAAIGTTVGVTGVEGIEVKIAPEGSATVAGITNLKPSTIEGALTAASFTYDSTGNTPTPLSVAADGIINGITFPASTPIARIGANTVTIEDYTVTVDKSFIIPAARTLTIAAGKTLTYHGPITIAPTGNLVLATDTGNSAAKIAGTGSITAGATAIKGDWEAVGTAAGTLTIASGAAGIGAAITADGTGATGLKASAAGAGITQLAGTAANSLTIAVATTIDLNGVAGITLVAALAAGNPGTLTLGAAVTSIILASADGTGTALTATGGGLFVATAADDKALCSAIASATGLAILPSTVTTTKLAKITGGTTSQTIKATATSTAGGNIILDKDSLTS